MIISKYLEAFLIDSKPTTTVWEIKSISDGRILGIVQWNATWRQYCFFPEKGTLFNYRCLETIETFLVRLNNKQKLKRNKK